MQPNGIITLTTDFGLTDSYVGVMKGVILRIAPSARLVDITHAIEPQDIQDAAYTVQTFYRYFAPGTIHLIVVDPGVGSTRTPVALATPEGWFVAPDNGVLTYVWREACERWGAGQCTVVALREPRFWLAELSSTFHGRDLFAPVAAHLARGTPIEALGPRLDGLIEADLSQPTDGRNGGLVGRIIHVDHFGNCITNITPQHLAQAGLGNHLVAEIIGQRIPGLYHTYADGPLGELIILIGSSNRLELAVRNGSAAKRLGVAAGDLVRVVAAELQELVAH